MNWSAEHVARIVQLDEALASQGVRLAERAPTIAAVREAVLAVLRAGPAGVATICKVTGQSESACRVMLHVLVRKKAVRRVARGRYALPEGR